jgi:hypothetical protein
MRTYVAAALIVVASHSEARERAVRSTPPPLDEQTLNSVVLDDGGNIDMRPGEQRMLRLQYWTCCVYPVPVTADVQFSATLPAHVSLDPGGLLTVGPDAYGGTSFRVYANIERGRRIVSTDVYVETKKSNPFVGNWTQVSELACDGGFPFPTFTPIVSLTFNGDRTFSVTWTPFEVYQDYWGFYAFDQPPGHLTMGIRHGNYVPDSFVGDGTYTITEKDGVRTLTMRGVFPGRLKYGPQSPFPACGAVFTATQ